VSTHEEVSAREADGRVTAGPEEPGEDRLADQATAGQTELVAGEEGGPGDHPRRPVLQVLARGVAALPRRSVTRAGRLPLRWRITSMAVLGAGVVAVAVASVLLATEAHRDDTGERARGAALAAATTEIRQILSYDYRNIGSDLATANSDTTGQFRGQFGILAGQLIGPAATQQHTVTTATVPNASVISATADQVVVLLFIDQSTTSKAQPKPQLTASQIRVTMEYVGGRWLVAQFQAL
jgi:Mce-associated membrane protein